MTVRVQAEDLELPDEPLTILKLKALLAKRGDVWGQMLMGKLKVRAAINHELVDDKALINDGDEVAFSHQSLVVNFLIVGAVIDREPG